MLVADGDWELQALETPHWLSDAAQSVAAGTLMLLCPGRVQHASITDHLRHEFVGTRWQAHALPAHPDRIDRLIDLLTNCAVVGVLGVYVGEVSTSEACEIKQAVDRVLGEGCVRHAAICSDAPWPAPQTPGLRLVRGMKRTGLTEAMQLFAMMHALEAPQQFGGADIDDLMACLGTERPAVIVEAAFDLPRQRFIWPSPQIQPLLIASENTAVCIGGPEPNMGLLLEVMRHLAKLARHRDGRQRHFVMPVHFERSVMLLKNSVRVR